MLTEEPRGLGYALPFHGTFSSRPSIDGWDFVVPATFFDDCLTDEKGPTFLWQQLLRMNKFYRSTPPVKLLISVVSFGFSSFIGGSLILCVYDIQLIKIDLSFRFSRLNSMILKFGIIIKLLIKNKNILLKIVFKLCDWKNFIYHCFIYLSKIINLITFKFGII